MLNMFVFVNHISLCNFFLLRFWFCFLGPDGFSVWEEEDAGGDAEAEPEGAQPSHERTGPRANEAGAAGEEDHRRHKENGQTGTDGEVEEAGLVGQGAKTKR